MKPAKAFIRPRAGKKKEETTAAGEETSPVAKTKSKVGTLPQLVWLWCLAPIMVLAMVAAVVFQLVVVAPAEARARVHADSIVRGVADQVRLQMAFINTRAAIASVDARLPAALASTEPDALNALEAELALAFPEAVGVRLLPLDWHSVDAGGNLPISNVTLDLLRQLRSENKVMPELIAGNQATPHILLATPIKSDAHIVGSLLIGLKADMLKHTLQELQGVPGYLELVQEIKGNVSALGSHGEAALKDEAAEAEFSVNDGQWQLYYYASPGEAALSTEAIAIYWAAFVVLTLVMLGASFLLLRRLDRAQHNDATQLLKALLDARSHGSRISGDGYTLMVFKDMAVTLGRLDWRPVSAGTESREEPAPAPGVTALPSSAVSLALSPTLPAPILVAPEIFRAYDIRGVVGSTLTVEVVRLIGQAIGSEAFDRGEQKIVVARDGRTHGPELLGALKQGLMESGRDVIDLGAVPTPLLYFATHYLASRSGVMLTGSHNPAEYNGLKIVLAGETLAGEDILHLRERIERGDLLSGQGAEESAHIIDDYIGQITSDVALSQPLKIVIDCGNGIAGAVAPTLYHALGCEVITLYCEVDGTFPNHHPDPSKPENLKELIDAVKQHGADVGLAFDGDGDRLGVVDSDGKIIWADRQLMLYAMDVLARHPGSDIIYDVKCSRHLARVIAGQGGRPVMWRTGHSWIKRKMRETGALLAGECSGHIFFKERWYGFDDGLYAGARLLEILAADFRKSAEIFRSLPEGISTPELNLAMADSRKQSFIEQLTRQAQFPGAEITTIDGIRVDFPDGWGLVRASNTTPCLVLRFEADTDVALKRIQNQFRAQLLALDTGLTLPF